jgi:hypothetical protein
MGADGKRIVFIEFNELCPHLLAKWIAAGLLPNFKRFHDASQVLTGGADVEDERFLEPWIQWYSLHTGLSYEQHGVFHLTDGPKAGHTDIWHALLDGGVSVGNCGGMNAPAFAATGSFYLPDPWCTTEKPHPEELAAYQGVVVTKVQENSSTGTSIGRPEYADIAKFLIRNGLRSRTVLAIGRQLLSEMRRGNTRWKRTVLLDKLQLDVFLKYWERMKPDFASFFLNSTAHLQHAYFHLLEPENFHLPADDLDDPVHQDAILFGYKEMDRILADFFSLEQHGVTLVLSTALSQQPNENAGRRYYRPRDAQALLARLDLHPTMLRPVMAHQYLADFPDAAATEDARTRLAGLQVVGRTVFDVVPALGNALFFGCGIGNEVAQNAPLALSPGANQTVPFFEVFYRMPHMKTGVHHPDSVLWFKTGTHRIHEGRTSILNLFPTLVDYYGVQQAPADGLPRTGRSIAEQVGLGHYTRQPRRGA